MKTTVYIARHSASYKNIVNYNNTDSFQVENEKQILSIIGERRAEKLSEYKELLNVDAIISSNYVRAIQTAKYVADKKNLEVIIDEDFSERKFGINTWDDISSDYFEKQYYDENYKTTNGESQKEVRERMYKALIKIIEKYKNKKIFIVSHATSICFLFSKWCTLLLTNPKEKIRQLYFNDEPVFDGKIKCPDLFKLEFDDNNNLISIKNIKIDN